jgi:hypothetical protein
MPAVVAARLAGSRACDGVGFQNLATAPDAGNGRLQHGRPAGYGPLFDLIAGGGTRDLTAPSYRHTSGAANHRHRQMLQTRPPRTWAGTLSGPRDRSSWRSSSLVPPHTPWTWCVVGANCKTLAAHRAAGANGFRLCYLPQRGPRGGIGKNRSGSQSRQAARDSRLAELALAAVVAIDIAGSPSLIACWCSRQEARAAGLAVFTTAGCCG